MRNSLDVLSLRPSRLPAVAPLLAAALAFGLIASYGWQQAEALRVPAYDGAFFEQVVWNVSRGRGFSSGYFSAGFLGLHFSPLLAAPAALTLLWSDPRLLGLLNAAALALAAPAAYLLFKALLGARPGAGWAAAALAVPVPLWPALQEAARAGFHTEALALPLVLVAAWAGLRGRSLLCWLCALLALGAKEDQAFAVAVVGLLLALHGPSRTHGWAMVAAAVLWAGAVELLVMPGIRGGVPSDIASYYQWLGRRPAPGALAAAVGNPEGWLAFASLVAAMAFLPLLRPAWLLLALPPLLGDLLSAHSPQPELHLQYALPLVVPVMVAGGLGAGLFLDAFNRAGLARAGLVALAAPALVLAVAFGPLLWSRPPAARPALGALLACATRIPLNAPVAADDDLAAPLASRPDVHSLSWAHPVDWVATDLSAKPPGYVDASGRARVLSGLPRSGRRLVCVAGNLQVWGPVQVG